MIKKIQLKNYRCFEDSTIDFRENVIIVGNNNVGKSTVIEAIRIVSYVAEKFKNTNYISPPSDFGIPIKNKGFKVNVDAFKIDLRSIVHKYKDSEGVIAEIKCVFSDYVTIKVYLSPAIVFATIEHRGIIINSKAQARNAPDVKIQVMPQLGLIRGDENRIDAERIRANLSTRLSSLHFRNQLLLYKTEYYSRFTELAESTWPGLRVQDLFYDFGEQVIKLLIYDSEFSGEIGIMGSGLQMWLQIVWFISRCNPESTIILDEPDVYMHPDLQKKLYRIIKSKFKQIVIATHSIEIISESKPGSILTIQNQTRKMMYADHLSAVQNIIDNLGSQQNLSLIRLGSAKKCVFVEGRDLKLLSQFCDILYPGSTFSLEQIPYVELGGWTRFDEALGASRLFYDGTGGEFEVFCLLDRDYHSENEIAELYKKAEENHLKLRVWKRKEIENYIISPQALFRTTELYIDQFDDFCSRLSLAIDGLYEETLTSIMNVIGQANRNWETGTIYTKANELMKKTWISLEDKIALANGKSLISLINTWMRENYNVKMNRRKMISIMHKEDVCDDVKKIIDDLRGNRN